MRIPCPYCGERDAHEFAYLGDATVKRPDFDARESLWVDYVYMRDNPAGRHREHWYHTTGCRSWLTVTRDTRTHQILTVEFASQGDAA
ncbi:MAG: sarcosine oxidase subunit delta [Alphaproteobacteria bacterium]|nr:sarcosine oxidase subunit delta [Alphaproteobacteria bacterium]